MIGYRAELLPDVCDIFADADRAGVLRKNQLHIADACRILSRGTTPPYLALSIQIWAATVERCQDQLF